MPRYFFSTSDAAADETGTELADPTTARRFAVRFAGEILYDQPELLSDDRTLSVAVTDEGQSLLFAIEVTMVTAPAKDGTG